MWPVKGFDDFHEGSDKIFSQANKCSDISATIQVCAFNWKYFPHETIIFALLAFHCKYGSRKAYIDVTLALW